MKKQPVKAKELPASQRICGFEEVVSGYTEAEAQEEAARCLQCKNPVCISGCPVGIDIKSFIGEINKKDYKAAYFKIREKNNFPSLCGRICPAEYQCRKACVLTKKGSAFASEEAINIHFLERFVGDYGMKNVAPPGVPRSGILEAAIAHLCLKGFRWIKACGAHFWPRKYKLEVPVIKDNKFSNIKVAVVGSGPAGLCCAGELARKGIKVTVFESLHKPGGVLRYGIPPLRLPRDILDFEINYLKALGVEIVPNFIVGPGKPLKELFSEGYKAIFLGLGAGTPSFLGVKGENLCNVYSANEFLTRVNLMSAYKFPEFHTPVSVGKHAVVIGGGNTAMDSARAALRLQKMNGIEADTTIVYRRTEVEMPARRLEIEHAREEGIKFKFLVKPEEFTGGQSGCVEKIRCLECKLGLPDSSGRRRPVAIEGSDFTLDCDQAIIAVGLKANQILTKITPELKVDKYGDVVVDPETMETSVKNIFAGGDIVGGEGTVIEAMGMAKKAAKAIIEQLS